MNNKKDTVTIYILDKVFNVKPTSTNVKQDITPKILKHSREVSLEDFAEEISLKGKVAVLCKFENEVLSNGRYDTPKRDKTLVSQELLMLDIDNNDLNESMFTYSEALENQFIKDNALFIYKTFSHSKEKDKFRICFRLDEKVSETQTIEKIYQALFNKFRQVDTSCGQTSRLFYGSNNGYEVIDWGNTLSVQEELNFYVNLKEDNKKVTLTPKRSREISLENLSTYSIADNEDVWKSLKYRNYKQAQKLIDKKIDNGSFKTIAGKSFTDRRLFKLQMLGNVPMTEFLDLPFRKSFLDVFHPEENPSSNVYQGRGKKQLYKCFSETNPFLGDIIAVVSKLTGKGYMETIDLIQELLHVEIKQDVELEKIKEHTLNLIDLMMDVDVKETSPNFYKLFGNARAIVKETLLILLDMVYTDKDTLQKHYIQYMSIKTLCVEVSAKLYLPEDKQLSETTMRSIINLMTLTDIIVKLPDKKVPKNLLKELKISQKIKHHKHRADVYEIVKNYRDAKEHIDSIDSVSKVLTGKGIYRTSISYDKLHLNLGEEAASKVFSQRKDKDKHVSQILSDIENLVIAKTHKSIVDLGYIKEDTLLVSIAVKFHIKKSDARIKLNAIENNFLEGYDLVAVRLNKKYKEKFNAPSKEKAVKIYIPKDEVITK